ncbi:MAG: hypothetical protein H7836_17155 [Magnetococcus sp. YQC-3]
MKKKRTGQTELDHPPAGQTVTIHNREQLEQILREIAQLRRHGMAIETDIYRSMSHICRSANRFLAPRRLRMQRLVADLMAFASRRKNGARPKGEREPKRDAMDKTKADVTLSYPST